MRNTLYEMEYGENTEKHGKRDTHTLYDLEYGEKQ